MCFGLHATDQLCSRSTECYRRPGIEEALVPSRLASRPQVVKIGGQQVGPSHHRRLRDMADEVRELGTKPKQHLGQFNDSSLDAGEPLGEPSLLPAGEDFVEDQDREMHGHSSGPGLAGPAVVHNSPRSDGGLADGSAERPAPIPEAAGHAEPERKLLQVGNSRLETIYLHVLCESHFRGTFRAFCERTRVNHRVVVMMGQGPGNIMGDGPPWIGISRPYLTML